MKTETIVLLSLQQALAYWERVNRVGDMIFHVCQKVWPYHKHLDNAESQKRFKALPGSELTSQYRLGRAVNNYTQLRKILEHGEDFNPLQFLPRIPKDKREKFTSQSEYLEAAYNHSLRTSAYLLPLFIQKWLGGKKVCEVMNPKQIKLVDTCERSYLSYLPYNSFILKLHEPLSRVLLMGGQQENHTCYYGEFLVYRDGDILKVLGLPSDLQFMGLTQEQKSILDNVSALTRNSTSKKVENTLHAYSTKCGDPINLVEDFLFEKINILSGNISIYDQNFIPQEFDPLAAIEKYLYKAKHKSTDEVLTELADGWSPGVLLFFLNGLGKLFYEYELPEEIKLYDLSPSNNCHKNNDHTPSESKISTIPEGLPNEHEAQKWYEVTQGNITFVTLPKSRVKKTGVKIHTGREMPPHLRRGHYRHFRDDDGVIVKKVFIKQATIRKDKLKNGETIHGSLSEYK